MTNSDSKTIFIAGSRELSIKRILSLFKRYIGKYQIVWGVYKEAFIDGFENQPQFRTLRKETLEKFKKLIKEKSSKIAGQLEIIEYSQKDEIDLIKKINPSKAIFINGSWKIVFHRRPIFDFLKENGIEFALKSPFVDEVEARSYSEKISNEINDNIDKKISKLKKSLTSEYFLKVADIVSEFSFDYTWQTGAVLVKDKKIILKGHNRILPYETYSMHHGSIRERNKAVLNDLNNYDTLHAEMDIISQAMQKNIDMKGATLYINLMPCPNCARMLATTGIAKLVCRHEHFGGFTKRLFEYLGIQVDLT